MTRFGGALAGGEGEPLRRRIQALAEAQGPGPEHVDTLLGMWAALAAGRVEGPRSSYLLVDLHRIFLFREPEGAEAAGIASVVRSIADGYPFQPFELLVDRFAAAQPFLYPADTLDLLPRFWGDLTPGELVTLDLATGEIARSAAEVHPHAHPIRAVAAADPPPPVELRMREAGVSLRAGTPVQLEGVVSTSVGPVREVVGHVNHASLPFATARVMWSQGRQKELSGGKALRPDDAALVATCEGLERFQVAMQPPREELVRGSFDELREHAIDPAALFFGGGEGTASRMPAYTGDVPLHWSWVFDPLGGAPRLVPAQEIWFTTPRVLGERYHVELNTNGYALGGSVEEAALFALFEAIERDAYMAMWYLRRRCTRIDPDSVSFEPFQLLRRRWHAAYPGYSLHFFDVTTDVRVPTVAAVAVRERGEGPRTFHAAAARLSGERACFTALKDLTGFTPRFAPGRLDEIRRLLDDPAKVDGPADHFELYALDETFERLAFMDFGPQASGDVREMDARALIPQADRYDLADVVRRLAEHLRPLGASLYLKDISHPALAARGARCVRAVTPGLFPIWFGSGSARLRVTERLKRLARELAGRDVTRLDELNLEIHPFS